MPKKSRRRKAKQLTGAAKGIQKGHPQQPRAVAVKPQSSAGASPEVEHFASRYQYVMTEVKRISIFAGSIILVLIILSFALG